MDGQHYQPSGCLACSNTRRAAQPSRPSGVSLPSSHALAPSDAGGLFSHPRWVRVKQPVPKLSHTQRYGSHSRCAGGAARALGSFHSSRASMPEPAARRVG